MKNIFLFICSLLIFSSCAALKLFEQKEPIYYNLGKAFTEATIQKIFKLETFKFETAGTIDLQALVPEGDLQKILGKNLVKALTNNLRNDFANDKVKFTIILKRSETGLFDITYTRTPLNSSSHNLKFYHNGQKLDSRNAYCNASSIFSRLQIQRSRTNQKLQKTKTLLNYEKYKHQRQNLCNHSNSSYCSVCILVLQPSPHRPKLARIRC